MKLTKASVVMMSDVDRKLPCKDAKGAGGNMGNRGKSNKIIYEKHSGIKKY